MAYSSFYLWHKYPLTFEDDNDYEIDFEIEEYWTGDQATGNDLERDNVVGREKDRYSKVA